MVNQIKNQSAKGGNNHSPKPPLLTKERGRGGEVFLLRIAFILIFTFLIFIVALPAFALPLVPCGTAGNPCTPCHLFTLADRVIDLALKGLALPILVIAVIAGGIIWLTAGGNPKNIDLGRKVLTSAIVGIFIAFGAWLIVSTILKTLRAGEGQLKWAWNEVGECKAPIVSQPPTDGGRNGIKPPPPQENKCPQCVPIGNYPVKPKSCKDTGVGQTCQVNTVLNNQLAGLNTYILTDKKFGYWHVTETWPPTVAHQNQCHQAGTCVDANLIGNSNNAKASDIKYFVDKAQAVGLRAVYEVSDQTRYNQLISAKISKDNLLYLPPKDGKPQITAEHFSIYSNFLKY